MKAKMSLIVVVMTMISAVSVNAQTLHAILFANTLDEKLGRACGVCSNVTNNELASIADYIGYNYEPYTYTGSNCSNENLVDILATLNCKKDDIVFFYYSGHGTRSSDDESLFPQMCLKYTYEEEKFFPVERVSRLIAEKKPRLSIVFSDCCNNEVNGVSPKPASFEAAGPSTSVNEKMIENIKKLFCENQGSIIATGCKKGQYSWYYTRPGYERGYFTFSFWDGMYIASKENTPTWQSVLQTAYDKTSSECFRDEGGNTYTQEPYYVCNITSYTHQEPRVQDDINFLDPLVNQSLSLSQRVALSEKIKTEMFSSDAKVQIMGRNMTTSLGVEDISVFLSRLSISKKIHRVNIINQSKNSTGKINFLSVHEVYNE